jgi:TIR domain
MQLRSAIVADRIAYDIVGAWSLGRVRYVTALQSQGVFISYRREDTGPYARLLKEHVCSRFPDVPVFMDLDSIEAGLDFAEVIESALRSCVVLIVLIGREWLTIADDDDRRRLDNPDDYVRFEIRTALQRCVRVVPVLVDGVKAPQRQQLPADLDRLARLNALEMSYSRFEYDEGRLMVVIQRVLASRTLPEPVIRAWRARMLDSVANCRTSLRFPPR